LKILPNDPWLLSRQEVLTDHGPHGPQVNAVSPGVIQTSMRPAESHAALTGEVLHIDGGCIALRRTVPA
jgi:NAD(P)-dependent dehydrogenase (short-subunit alcohol dehydrogenase family)